MEICHHMASLNELALSGTDTQLVKMLDYWYPTPTVVQRSKETNNNHKTETHKYGSPKGPNNNCSSAYKKALFGPSIEHLFHRVLAATIQSAIALNKNHLVFIENDGVLVN